MCVNALASLLRALMLQSMKTPDTCPAAQQAMVEAGETSHLNRASDMQIICLKAVLVQLMTLPSDAYMVAAAALHMGSIYAPSC